MGALGSGLITAFRKVLLRDGGDGSGLLGVDGVATGERSDAECSFAGMGTGRISAGETTSGWAPASSPMVRSGRGVGLESSLGDSTSGVWAFALRVVVRDDASVVFRDRSLGSRPDAEEGAIDSANGLGRLMVDGAA